MHELKNDIEKYLRGELSPAEMHALEKRALDDPFLADALEGASQLEHQQLTSDVNDLQKKLSKRVDEKKGIPLWVWPARIAAGLLLIIVSGYIIFNLTQQDDPASKIASNERVKQDMESPGDSANKDTTIVSGNDKYLSMAETKEPAAELKPSTEAASRGGAKPAPAVDDRPNAISSQPADSVRTVLQSLAEAEAVKPSETEEDAFIDAKKEIAKSAPAPAADKIAERSEEVTRSKRKAENRAQSPARASEGFVGIDTKKIKGRVTSAEDGAGLPGVNVVIKGTSTGTVTDIEGNYQIDLANTNSTLVYSFIGLESTEVPVKSDSTMNVSMSNDAAQLSEVVVTGYGEAKTEDNRLYSTFEMAEPAGGRKAFKKYLESRMIYPQVAIENKIEGKVTIQFTVETSGQLSNFNVIKGIGYGCDTEVIRLVKEGPKWAPTKRNDEPVAGKVRVRMRFSLPKK